MVTHVVCTNRSHFTPDLVPKDFPQTEQTCDVVGLVLANGSAGFFMADEWDFGISIKSDEPWKLVSSRMAGRPNPTHGLDIDWLATSSWWYFLVWKSFCEDGVIGEKFCDSKSSEDQTLDDDRATEEVSTGCIV
jgi:hypothetical protein